jgi:S1-C subfamily serine protease
MGSGAMLDTDGHILTVGYVVMGARTIQVTLSDERQFPARLLCQDFESGLAVLQTSRGNFSTVSLGEAATLKEGDRTIIVAATDQAETQPQRMASSGFISALRPFDAYWEYMLDRAILTTAVNPGFGGGPMLDAFGRVVGVVSLNLNSIKETSLAIPIDLFHEVRESIYTYGQILGRRPRPWIGIYGEPVESGVAVIGLIPNGPASRAGLKVKDIILELDGIEVSSRREMYERMWKRPAGEEFRLNIQRGENIQDVRVTSMDRAEFYR